MSDFIHGMSMTDYRALPGVGFHDLQDFKKSPLYFYRKRIMKVIPDWSSDSMEFGTCVHSLVLEGQDAFNAVCVKCPDEFVTPGGAVSTAKAAKAWAVEQGDRIILSPQDYALVVALSARVRANKRAHELLSNGRPEVVSRWTHHSGVECRSRADWLHADYIVDLKTCGDLDEFPADAIKYGYHAQAAFYAEAFKRSCAYIVAVEKREPNRVGVWKVGPMALLEGRASNDKALFLMSAAQETDAWPGDLADEQLLEIPTQLTKQGASQ